MTTVLLIVIGVVWFGRWLRRVVWRYRIARDQLELERYLASRRSMGAGYPALIRPRSTGAQ